MTNRELDRARSDEVTAPEISPADWACADWADPIGFGLNDERHGRAYAAMMARTGWTPPVTVDSDLAEAERLAYAWHVNEIKDVYGLALAAIKRGRALAATEAKPGMVWVKHDGSRKNPLDRRNSWILVNRAQRGFGAYYSSNDAMLDWRDVTHYAIITPPAEDVA